eukprot:1473769-Prymnesium_polylepis.1
MDATCSSCTAPTRPARSPTRLPPARSPVCPSAPTPRGLKVTELNIFWVPARRSLAREAVFVLVVKPCCRAARVVQ